jgi:hypothetical protein
VGRCANIIRISKVSLRMAIKLLTGCRLLIISGKLVFTSLSFTSQSFIEYDYNEFMK